MSNISDTATVTLLVNGTQAKKVLSDLKTDLDQAKKKGHKPKYRCRLFPSGRGTPRHYNMIDTQTRNAGTSRAMSSRIYNMHHNLELRHIMTGKHAADLQIHQSNRGG